MLEMYINDSGLKQVGDIMGNIFGGQLFAANSRGLRRCSPAVRGGFFSEQWRSSRGLCQFAANSARVRANSRELRHSPANTGGVRANSASVR